MATKVYTFEEVKAHNKIDDCWLIISGKVYNLTPFLEEHPGGDDILVTSTGKDATIDFLDVGHSNVAENKMKELCIGEIDASTLPSNAQNIPPPNPTPQGGGSSSGALLYVVALLVIGIAFVLRLYSTKEA